MSTDAEMLARLMTRVEALERARSNQEEADLKHRKATAGTLAGLMRRLEMLEAKEAGR